MSGLKIIRALLVANSALIALVPSARVIAGVLPQATALPAIAVTEVSATEIDRIDAQATHTMVTARVQVTVFATTYPTQKTILDAARKACNYQRGTVASITVVSVRRGSNGPDFNDPDTGFFMQSVDFLVTYHEAN